MALQKHMFPFIIVSFSIISCYNSLHDDPSCNNNNNSFQQEYYGYNGHFEAYPSYFSISNDDHLEGSKFFNGTRLRCPSSNMFERFLASVKNVISVDDFGAKGDGDTDDTEAFKKAWKKACSSSTGAVLVVPKSKTYLLRPIRFSGPCNSNLKIKISGTIDASEDRSDYGKDPRHWIIFDGVQNLTVEGGGIINGNGEIWWLNSCKINKALPCTDAPTALTFYKNKNLVVKNIWVKNAQQIHVSFDQCVNVKASNLTVTAPEESPNTDGIHVTHTQNIQISGCVIGTGDDCISIVSGCKKVQAKDITCGPGHGISIGSLGSNNSKAYVSDIKVNGATLTGTTNGVRIKTWQGGSGSASNIRFQNINMENVENPIIINQNYCDDQSKPCQEQRSAVEIQNVVYKNIRGTSASDVAITLDCSESFPCQGIMLEDIDLVNVHSEAKAVCNSVTFIKLEDVFPRCPST